MTVLRDTEHEEEQSRWPSLGTGTIKRTGINDTPPVVSKTLNNETWPHTLVTEHQQTEESFSLKGAWTRYQETKPSSISGLRWMDTIFTRNGPEQPLTVKELSFLYSPSYKAEQQNITLKVPITFAPTSLLKAKESVRFPQMLTKSMIYI